MKLYVSGPIKGVAAARDNFRAGAEALALSGHVAVDPFDCAPLCPDGCPGEPSEAHYDHYLRGDLAAMMACEGVALLFGWEASRGARIEVATAVAVGIEVRPLADWLGQGWRCGGCGSIAYDGSEILWPPDGRGVSDLVCPQCGAVGEFVDA